MIFITLGSQKFQFNRLLKAVEQQIDEGKITDEVFAQTGYSDYVPEHFQTKKFLDRDEFLAVMQRADIVITHGGTGAIVGAVKQGKKVIAVPRLSLYGEHVDDHQLQLIGQFTEMNLILSCTDVNELFRKIEEARRAHFSSYISGTQIYINTLGKYIDSYSRV